MICQKCGTPVDGQFFCPRCGTPVAGAAPYQTQPNSSMGTQSQGNHVQVLVFGIVSVAVGCCLAIFGLIFSIIGIVKANNYVSTYGDISKQVRIGKKLAIAGIFASIGMTILYTFLIIMAIQHPDALKTSVAMSKLGKL